MADTPTHLSTGAALAGGAIAVSLLETLLDKGILSLDESRGVLDRALKALGGQYGPEQMAAAQVVTSLMRGKFTTRRQDK